MYLDKILGTATKINILGELVSRPDRKFVEKELAVEIGMAASGVNRQIRDLVECGVVRLEKAGKTSLYRINTKHFLFPALKKLFTDLNKVYREMAEGITKHTVKKHDIEAVILIGSAKKRTVSQNYVKQPSDLDLLIIGKKPKEILDDVIKHTSSETFERYGVNCYPIIMAKEEYRKRLKKDDPFVLEAQVEGELLYGKKPSRLD